MKQLQSFTVRLLAGANAATVACMLLIGFSYYANPERHPLIANINLAFPLFLAANVAFLVFWLLFRKRMALITVAGLVAGYVPIRTYTPLNIGGEAPEGCIKVMSYNVFNFSTWADPSEPCDILDYIKSEHPDILCLEEYGLSGWKKDMCYAVLDSMYAYSDHSNSQAGGDAIAIYSRFPIVGKESIRYESRTNNSAAFRLVTAKDDTTTVVVNHLESTGLSPEDRTKFKSLMKGGMPRQDAEQESRRMWHKLGEASARRAPQADAVAEYVARHKDRSLILVGDFNDSPLSYVHHRLASELTDCYVQTANGPGISYHYNNFYVRIDNIMCSNHWTPYQCRVDSRVKGSDHYPITCLLKRN